MKKFIPKFVDLDLPSGTLWAKCNYGTEKETDSGNYYDWDEAMNLPIKLPTKEQFEELVKNTISRWIYNFKGRGVNGRLFTSLVNRNSIFIPAVGRCVNNSIVHDSGYVWSSNIDYNGPNGAYYLYFSSDIVCPYDSNYRFYGQSVRAVKSK